MNALVAAVLGLTLALLPAVAWAQALVVGSVRDTEGYAVAGALVTATGPTGKTLATATSAADGTFALDVPSDPAAIGVACPYCLPVRLHPSPGTPLVAIVRRFPAVLDRAPSAADLAASPYGRPINEIGVQPFTLVEGNRISDRGLNRGNGLVVADGAASYRLTDGGNVFSTIPARDVQAVEVQRPFDAFRYGAGAGGGWFELDQLGDVPKLAFLAGHGDTALGVYPGSGFGAAAAQSYDNGIDNRRLDVRATTPFAGGRLTALGGVSSNAYQNDESGSLAYATTSRRYETFAGLAANRSAYGTYLADVASSVDAAFRVRTRSPVVLEFGALLHNASGYYQTNGTALYNVAGYAREYDAYASATASGAWGSSTAAVEFSTIARGAVRSNDAGLTAILPSLSYTATLSPSWQAHIAASSSLRTPTLVEDVVLAGNGVASVDRNSLYEASLQYGDQHRLRAEAVIFRQQTAGSAAGAIAGEGLSVQWQIAPAFSLRAWGMPLHENFPTYAYDGGNAASPTHRELLWLTYASPATRIDTIWADHTIAASLTVGIAKGVAVFAATEQPTSAPRRVNAGLRWQP